MFLEWENNSGKLQINRKFQNSGKFQNNAINDVKQISRSHVITPWIDTNFSCNFESELCEELYHYMYF